MYCAITSQAAYLQGLYMDNLEGSAPPGGWMRILSQPLPRVSTKMCIVLELLESCLELGQDMLMRIDSHRRIHDSLGLQTE